MNESEITGSSLYFLYCECFADSVGQRFTSCYSQWSMMKLTLHFSPSTWAVCWHQWGNHDCLKIGSDQWSYKLKTLVTLFWLQHGYMKTYLIVIVSYYIVWHSRYREHDSHSLIFDEMAHCLNVMQPNSWDRTKSLCRLTAGLSITPWHPL